MTENEFSRTPNAASSLPDAAHAPFNAQGDGLAGTTSSPAAPKEPTARLFLSDLMNVDVPTRYLDSRPNRHCRIDASIASSLRLIEETVHLYPSVSGGAGCIIDLGCRVTFDGRGGHEHWAARQETEYDRLEWSIGVDGQRLWESSTTQFETHLGQVISSLDDYGVFKRLDAGQALVRTFQLMETLLPAPFQTLDEFMHRRSLTDVRGDHAGKAFSVYLLESIRWVEQLGYPVASKITYYRFLHAWSNARGALGIHFRVVPGSGSGVDLELEREIKFRPDVSITP